MNRSRLIAAILALGLHGAVLFALFAPNAEEPLALDAGSGADRFTVVAAVSLENSDLFTQSAQAAAVDAVATRAAPREPREEQLLKPETKSLDAPAQQQPEEQKQAAVTQPASVAAAAQDEQQAAAALAARRTKLWSAYQAELHAALERAKVKTQTGWAGKVRVEATIAPSGELLSHSIVESSGVAELDRTAIASLQRAAPFPPIPPGVSREPLTLTIPFEYRLR